MGAHQSRAQDPFFNYRLFQGVKVSMFEGLSNNADTADTLEGVGGLSKNDDALPL